MQSRPTPSLGLPPGLGLRPRDTLAVDRADVTGGRLDCQYDVVSVLAEERLQPHYASQRVAYLPQVPRVPGQQGHAVRLDDASRLRSGVRYRSLARHADHVRDGNPYDH